MGHIKIDLAFLPIFMVHYDGLVPDEEFKTYLAQVERTLYAPDARPRVIVHDARAAGQSPATQRKLQADWLKQHDARLRALTLGSVFVIDSALIRGILTAILWLQPLAMPHEVCATIEDALDWGVKRLQDRDLTVSPSARAGILMKYGVRKAASG